MEFVWIERFVCVYGSAGLIGLGEGLVCGLVFLVLLDCLFGFGYWFDCAVIYLVYSRFAFSFGLI